MNKGPGLNNYVSVNHWSEPHFCHDVQLHAVRRYLCSCGACHAVHVYIYIDELYIGPFAELHTFSGSMHPLFCRLVAYLQL